MGVEVALAAVATVIVLAVFGVLVGLWFDVYWLVDACVLVLLVVVALTLLAIPVGLWAEALS